MKHKTLKIGLISVGVILILVGVLYSYMLSPTTSSNKKIKVTIPQGTSTIQIANILEENELIHNAEFFRLYLKINKVNSLKASTYEFKMNYGLVKIVNLLEKGNTYNENNVNITFNEGINMRKVAKIIDKNTNNTYAEVLKKVTDRAYIQTLIDKYWFLTPDILDNNIYYPLEGYLFPNTYQFASSDVTINEIFITMLDEENKVLSKYKSSISNSKYSIHELLTIASMAEAEGSNATNRKGIAGVFYNRLNIKMSLGSDVTTYYAFKVEMSDRDITSKELSTYNPYNTRGPQMAGKLPIGPICNPSIDSIEAAINPENNNYLYFVADKNKKIYFTKTETEHNNIIAKLKSEGLWLTW